MSDLIRRDEALAGILNHYEINNKNQNKEMDYCFDMLNSLRAVDAVSVVRCRECKWFGKPGCAILIVDDSDRPTENDFCSFGERREENEID